MYKVSQHTQTATPAPKIKLITCAVDNNYQPIPVTQQLAANMEIQLQIAQPHPKTLAVQPLMLHNMPSIPIAHQLTIQLAD